MSGNRALPSFRASKAFQSRFSAETGDQPLIVDVGNGCHVVQRCDELLGAQPAAEEGVGVEDVGADHAEGAHRHLGVETQKLRHQLEGRLHALDAEGQDLDDCIVLLVWVDRDLQNGRAILEVEVAVVRIVEVLLDQFIEVCLDLTVDLLLALGMELLDARD